MKFTKFLPILLSSMVCSCPVFAAENDSAFGSNGFYAGIGIGGDSTKINQTNTDLSTSVDGLDETGTAYGVYLGYQTSPLWKNFNMAVEGYAEAISNAKNTYSLVDPSNPSVFQKKNNIGLSLLPGYLLDPRDKVYLRLGLVESQFDYNSSFNSHVNYSNNVLGYQLGIGNVFNVWKNLGIRGEVDWTTYNTVNENHANDNENTKYTSFAYKIGLQWSF